MSNRKIEKINDYQLLEQMNAVRAHIRRAKKNESNSHDAETELCYLERELEHRENAKKIHEIYVKNMKKIQEEIYLRTKEEEEATNEFLESRTNNDLLFY
jgi:hypothetical protein